MAALIRHSFDNVATPLGGGGYPGTRLLDALRASRYHFEPFAEEARGKSPRPKEGA